MMFPRSKLIEERTQWKKKFKAGDKVLVDVTTHPYWYARGVASLKAVVVECTRSEKHGEPIIIVRCEGDDTDMIWEPSEVRRAFL